MTSIEVDPNELTRRIMNYLFKNPFAEDERKNDLGIKNGATLVIQEEDYHLLRNHLLRPDGMERISFVFFGIQGKDPLRKLFVHRVINLEDSDYSSQTPSYVVPRTKKQIEIFKAFEEAKTSGLLHVHSHPFCRKAQFSPIDENMAVGAIRSLRDYLLAGGIKSVFYFGRMVFGQDEGGFSGSIQNQDSSQSQEIINIQVVGPRGISKINSKISSIKDPGEALPDPEILDRNIRWLGDDGQRKLSETHLVICGLGGAGSLVALNARGLGFKKITLIDHDRIEKSNLNRLPGATRNDVGEFKVVVMKRMIEEVGLPTEVVAIPQKMELAQKALKEGDILIAGVDSFKARFDLQIWAARHLIPLIDIGSGILINQETRRILAMGGQVSFYIPGGPCLCCQAVVPREIDSEISLEVKRATGYVQGTDLTPTSVVTINSIMAGQAMDMLIKYISGLMLPASHIKCDLLSDTYGNFNFRRKELCPICGDNGIEGVGEETVQLTPHHNWRS